jgi:hypothetical protein
MSSTPDMVMTRPPAAITPAACATGWNSSGFGGGFLGGAAAARSLSGGRASTRSSVEGSTGGTATIDGATGRGAAGAGATAGAGAAGGGAGFAAVALGGGGGGNEGAALRISLAGSVVAAGSLRL